MKKFIFLMLLVSLIVFPGGPIYGESPFDDGATVEADSPSNFGNRTTPDGANPGEASSSFASAGKALTQNEGDEIILAHVESGQKIELVTSFHFLIDNSLKLLIDGKLVYKLFIPGSNSYTRGYLIEAKKAFDARLLKRPKGPVKIVGTVWLTGTSLVNSDQDFIVSPTSLRILGEGEPYVENPK